MWLSYRGSTIPNQNDLAEGHRLLGEVASERVRPNIGVVEDLRGQVRIAANDVSVGLDVDGMPLNEILDLGILDARAISAWDQPGAAILGLEDKLFYG